ncbi:MAG: hypothetical protein ACOY0T_37360 [Myxococcota bacterium]
MAGFVIPGGKNKGLPIEQAEVSDLDYWFRRISEELQKDPNKQSANRDRALCKALSGELTRRKNGGQKVAAPSPKTQALATADNAATQVLAGSWNDVRVVDAELRKAQESMHLVSPATVCGSLPEGCEVAISVVYIDSNSDDVYPVGGGKKGLSGHALKRIRPAAGIDWDTERSGRLDNGKEPLYVHYRAVGWVLDFDGTPRRVSGEVELDLRENSPQVDAMRARSKEGSNFESQLRDTRLFILRHAETKAKLRAICDLGVKRSYTDAELQKPFAVARLMATGRTNDPVLREKFAIMNFERMLNRGAALYGRPPTPALPQHAPPQASEPSEFAGHAAPPVGAVDDDGDAPPYGYDEDEPLEAEGESVPDAKSSPSAAPPPAAAQPQATPTQASMKL